MKNQVKVKGFRFQVYCSPENKVHIHTPEEIEKLTMELYDFREKFKPFMKELKKLEEGQGLFIENFRVDYHPGIHEDTFRISLGKEKVCVGKEHFLEKMQEFRKLVEED